VAAVARPRSFDEAQVLRTARERFSSTGYAATSIDEVAAATGLGKGSLYGAFGDKHQLFLRVFDGYCADVREQVEQALAAITEENRADVKEYRGRGLVWGLEFHDKGRAERVAKRAFELGLLIETSGPESEVVKLLPALTVTADEMDEGLSVLARAVRETI
jgi:AcrR family transcriptional regulator